MAAVTVAALALAGCGESPTSPSSTPIAATLTLGTAPFAPPIPDDFLGLGFETGVMQDPRLGDPILDRFVANLGPGVMRFGGNSVEFTVWQLAGAPATGGFVLGQSDLDRVVGLARRVNWRIILDLNLRRFDPAAAARAATGIAATAGDRLEAFEIGNEPNLYPVNGNRAPTWNVDSNRAEFAAYAAAIEAALPRAPLAGPATGPADDGAWLAAFLADRSIPLALATDHFYPMGVSAPSDGPERATLENLISRALMARTAAHVESAVAAARARGLPLRIDESNSAFGFGQPGVSDVHASALWGLDHLWTLADAGAVGINVQSGTNLSGGLTCRGIYLPFCESAPGTYLARPLYYAMLAFHAGARGRPIGGSLDVAANVAAHASLDDGGTARVTLINEEATRPLQVVVPAGGAALCLAFRLTGPALDARTGTSFAGAQVASDGSWAPGPPESLPAVGGHVTVEVAPASAVVLVLERFGSGR